MKRFYDSKCGGVTQPSQRKYVHYFADLLAGKIDLQSPWVWPLYRMRPVYTLDVYRHFFKKYLDYVCMNCTYMYRLYILLYCIHVHVHIRLHKSSKNTVISWICTVRTQRNYSDNSTNHYTAYNMCIVPQACDPPASHHPWYPQLWRQGRISTIPQDLREHGPRSHLWTIVSGRWWLGGWYSFLPFHCAASLVMCLVVWPQYLVRILLVQWNL